MQILPTFVLDPKTVRSESKGGSNFCSIVTPFIFHPTGCCSRSNGNVNHAVFDPNQCIQVSYQTLFLENRLCIGNFFICLYSSVEAPPKRGFSSIEMWFIGVQVPILLGVLEYGIILAIRKFSQKSDHTFFGFPSEMFFKLMDLICLLLCVFYFILFNITYFSFYS